MKFGYMNDKKLTINPDKIINTIIKLKYDFYIIAICFLALIILKLYIKNYQTIIIHAKNFENNNISDSSIHFFNTKKQTLPHYEIKRDIFNFNTAYHNAPLQTPKITESENIKEMSDKDIINYSGLIILGNQKTALISINNQYYIASEGEIISNKYKLLQANQEYLEIVDLDNNKKKKIINTLEENKYY